MEINGKSSGKIAELLLIFFFLENYLMYFYICIRYLVMRETLVNYFIVGKINKLGVS